MKNHWICSLLMIIILTSCNTQNNMFLHEKSLILENQSKELIELAKVVDIIDSDIESYWAYNYADSILAQIDTTGQKYFNDLTKIYSAYTHIFYGMSYTKTIFAISRGDKYSLEELNNTLIQPSSKDIVDYDILINKELSSIYSMINFYKVSRMERYDDMYTLFQNDSLANETTLKNYPLETAYRIVSLENKKMYFKIIGTMISDIYSINNQNIDEVVFNQYGQGLVKLGEEMDKIPSDHDEIVKLTEQEYYEYILKSSEIQKTMLDLLVTEIRILGQSNE